MSDGDGDGIKIVHNNRKARHEYHIEDRVEAGISLKGTEVKSVREARVNLRDSFCGVEHGDMYMYNCHIAPYEQAGHFNHDPMRPRKLLLHRSEIRKWQKMSEQKGYTIVPLKLYFKNGYAKVELGLGKGKKHYDKRQDIAERETKRRMEREMRRAEKRR